MDKDANKLKKVSKELSRHNIEFTRVEGIDTNKLDSYQINNRSKRNRRKELNYG